MKYFLLILTSAVFEAAFCAAPSCLGPNGLPVDWFAAYKMPKVKGTTWRSMQSGAALVYVDAKNSKWQRLDKLINDSSSIIGQTVAPLFGKSKNSPTLLWAMYNDQPPPTRESERYSGHAKGLILFNQEGGLWLVHSIPGFPSRPNFEGIYEYPSSGHLNGQSILCMSLPISELEKVAKQLYYDKVVIYDSNFPSSFFTSSRPYLAMLKNPDAKRPPSPYYSNLDIFTNNAVKFRVFAKDSYYKPELYADDVAKDLKTGLIVQGWRGGNASSNMPSACSNQYQVMNVESLHFDAPLELDHDIAFDNSIDHSKWAVSLDVNKPWICIGDINRQYGQLSRGGGTVCLNNKATWKAYNDLVERIENCKTSTG